VYVCSLLQLFVWLAQLRVFPGFGSCFCFALVLPLTFGCGSTSLAGRSCVWMSCSCVMHVCLCRTCRLRGSWVQQHFTTQPVYISLRAEKDVLPMHTRYLVCFMSSPASLLHFLPCALFQVFSFACVHSSVFLAELSIGSTPRSTHSSRPFSQEDILGEGKEYVPPLPLEVKKVRGMC